MALALQKHVAIERTSPNEHQIAVYDQYAASRTRSPGLKVLLAGVFVNGIIAAHIPSRTRRRLQRCVLVRATLQAIPWSTPWSHQTKDRSIPIAPKDF